MSGHTTKMTSKGQIMIPKELREKYQFKEGAPLLLLPLEEGILLKHDTNSLRSLRGLMKKELDLEKAEEFIKTLRKEWRI